MKTKQKPFAAKLRSLREARGWSQAELAEKCGVTQAVVSYLESGRNQPTWETVKELAKAFGVSTEEFR